VHEDALGEVQRRLQAAEQDATAARLHAGAAEQVDRGFEQFDRGFAEMRGKFDATASGQQRILVTASLIDQQDR